MATGSTWRVGTLTVPSSATTVSVTGLGGTPAAVFFYGTNWLTEDTAVTTTGCGMFRGMVAPQWDTPGTLLQHAAAVLPAGDAHVADTGRAIRMPDTSGVFNSYVYGAVIDSLDADGFTVDWDIVTAGGYKVVYAALMDVTNAGGYIGGASTLSLGWKAGASLLHGAWAALPGTGGSDRTQEFYGGGAYPGTFSPSWFAAGLTAFTFPTSSGAQYNIGIYNQAPSTAVAQGGSFIGPFLTTQNVTAVPTGGGLTDFTLSFNDSTNGGMLVVWDDEDNQTGRLTPGTSQGNTATVSGLPFAPGLLIGYSISDEPPGQNTGGRGAVGFSVVAPGFQWTALVDGNSSYGAFQSFQRGVADVVDGTSVHAATIDLTNDGFVVTTEEDDVSPATWVWHAFGHPTRVLSWIPHIYRRVVGYASGRGPAVPIPGELLLEEGTGRIEREEGDGYLIL